MDTEVVAGEEAEVGEETGVGKRTIVGSNTGMTETGTETETETEIGIGIGIGTGTGTGIETETETGTGTGTRGMEVGINQAPTRDTTPTIRDHIMTATDLYSNPSGVVSIYDIHSLITCIAIPYVAMCN